MPVALNLPFFDLATPTAHREQFLACFRVTPESITECIRKLVAELSTSSPTIIPIIWKKQVIDGSKEGGRFRWFAFKAEVPPEDIVTAELPLSVESQLIVQKLLGEIGNAVILPTEILAFMGGMAVVGEFLMKPSIQVRPRRGDLKVAIAELYQSVEIPNCQMMSGFAMVACDGMWIPHMWLITPDGSVIDTDEGHSHYFGVRFSPETAKIYCSFLDKESED